MYTHIMLFLLTTSKITEVIFLCSLRFPERNQNEENKSREEVMRTFFIFLINARDFVFLITFFWYAQHLNDLICENELWLLAYV